MNMLNKLNLRKIGMALSMLGKPVEVMAGRLVGPVFGHLMQWVAIDFCGE